jgi:hypothetical protein
VVPAVNIPEVKTAVNEGVDDPEIATLTVVLSEAKLIGTVDQFLILTVTAEAAFGHIGEEGAITVTAPISICPWTRFKNIKAKNSEKNFFINI